MHCWWRTECVLLLVLFCVVRVNSQWKPSNLPYGIPVHTYSTVDSLLLAGTDVGLYVSSDRGTSWTTTGGSMTGAPVLCFAETGASLFVGLGVGGGYVQGIYCSTDKGVTWEWRAAGLVMESAPYLVPVVRGLLVLGGSLLAGTSAGVFISHDSGQTWTPSNTGLTDKNVLVLAQMGARVLVGTANGGVLTSLNGGASWSPTNSGLSDACVPVLLSHGTVIYAGTRSTGVFASTNGGGSWAERNTGLGHVTINALSVIESTLCAATETSLYRSIDGAATWVGESTGLFPTRVFGMIVFGDRLYAASSNGSYFSRDEGLSWHPGNAGLSRQTVYSLAAIDTCVFAGTGDFGVLVVGQSGTTVCGYDTSRLTYGARAIVGTSTEQFAGTWGDGVSRSTNGGNEWIPASAGLPTTLIHALLLDGPRLFAAGHGDVALSTDHGTHWSSASVGLSTPIVYCFKKVGTDLFAGTDKGVFLSTDNGAQWTPASDGLPVTHVLSLGAMGSELFAGTYGSGVYRSTDSGLAWLQANTGMTASTVVSALATINQYLFAGTFQGIFLSTDRGMTWDSLNAGLPARDVRCFAAAGDHLFAGTLGGGLHHLTLSDIVLANTVLEDERPKEIVLSQNFPNPFNPSTTIGYALPTRVHVDLSVFNLLGQKVAVLVDGVCGAGLHECTFDGNGLASGVYLYRLTAGFHSMTRKLMLLR